METEKLYYTEPETSGFSALVLSCEKAEEGWEVSLDKTAFYPEGGGQPCDLGLLGGVEVRHVSERDGVVFHLLGAPLSPGATVRGEIDARRRRDYTEQHTADHLISGLLHKKYGCDNVGFHMGAEVTTIDLNVPLSPRELAEAEEKANAVIRADLPITELWPTPEELLSLDYRSKKELTGRVRLISIPGVDLCACCGTHLRSTGGLGLLKIISSVPFRGGVRLELLAGARAWDYVAACCAENREISALLSAKPAETAAAVRRLSDERLALRGQLAEAEKRFNGRVAAENAGKDGALVFEPGLSVDELRRLADALIAVNGGVCAAFSDDGEGGFRYVIAQNGGDVRGTVKRMNLALNGRGGGKPHFATGRVAAPREEIEKFFREG